MSDEVKDFTGAVQSAPKPLKLMQKLAELRAYIAGLDLKRSGHNNHTGFTFFELKDFLPQTLAKMAELKMIGVIDFSQTGNIILELSDTEEQADSLSFYSKQAPASIQGASSIQNIGGEQSYQRRYLWSQVVELCTPDDVDMGAGQKKNPERDREVKFLTKERYDTIMKLATIAELNKAVEAIAEEGIVIGKDKQKGIEARRAELAPGNTPPPAEIKWLTAEDFDKACKCHTSKELIDIRNKMAQDKVKMTDQQKDKLRDILATLLEGEKITPPVKKVKDDLDLIFANPPAGAKKEETPGDRMDEQIAELEKLL